MTDRLTILQGDALEQLRPLPDESVQCAVTSPPYYGLRNYGHKGQLGLEKTPEDYVAKMVVVFRELRRVMHRSGTFWLNIGDSYASGKGKCYNPGGNTSSFNVHLKAENVHPLDRGNKSTLAASGLKPKDLIGIPWRLAFALQSDGWWLRQDIIWNKANCIPESVTDRCTKSHEYLFMLTKSSNYYYDSEAIKEPASESDWESRLGRANLNNKLLPTEDINGIRPRVKYTGNAKARRDSSGGPFFKDAETYNGKNQKAPVHKNSKQRGHSRRHEEEQCSGMRNKRDVWTIAPANFPEAHFATYPPDLIRPCILAGSRVGDTILDPFAGSGTTGMVALELGRKAILIELNPEYVELIERRCDVTPGLAL